MWRDYRISEWERMLQAEGFSPEVIYTFDLTLHFDKWTTRMATPQQNRDMLKALFNVASQDIKQGFNLPQDITNDDFTFIIPGAVIKGQC